MGAVAEGVAGAGVVSSVVGDGWSIVKMRRCSREEERDGGGEERTGTKIKGATSQGYYVLSFI